jgi:4-diphosphocytidyl-2-C-methyl-D-erythritol kinase
VGMECSVKAYAKINLSLDVTGKREDGYHLLQTVMQSVDLYDELHIRVEKASKGSKKSRIILETDNRYIPGNKMNTVYMATEAFMETQKDNRIREGLIISYRIQKRIPTQAGLGGGSADAAGALLALNTIFGKPLTERELFVIGESTGADVPFCMRGGTALCEGIGEIITPLKPLEEIPVLILKPPFGIPTPWIFKNLKRDGIVKHPDTRQVIRCIEDKDIYGVFQATENVLEKVSVSRYPMIGVYKRLLLSVGAVGALMSGSGSSVYGVFKDIPTAERAFGLLMTKMKNDQCQIFLNRMVAHGPKIF